ncbi:PAS domain S-box protein [Methanocella sp. MCL-LM]|uniref:PAS domain S-box protein n=1 Tax=Methanocella sp. MCL-LM TaxID=3412035 RepID=UPI003C7146B6
MDGQQKELKQIIELLKISPKGMTISEVSKKLGMGRNSVAKYLDMLRISGQVEMKTFGRSKIYSVSGKISIATALSLSSDLIVFIDEDLKVVEVNEQFLKHTGLKRKEVIGQSLESHTIPLFLQPEILLNIREALRGREYAREIKVTENRDEGYYFIKLIPISPGYAHPKAAIVYENITARKKAEIALKESEARYRVVVEEQSEMIVRLKPDMTIVFANEQWCRLFRAGKEDVIGRRFGDLVPAELRDQLRQHMYTIRKDGHTSMYEVKVKVPGGEERWIQETYRGTFSDEGMLTEFQIVGRDITDLKRLEDSLRLTQYTVDHSRENIAWIRPDGTLDRFNEAACRTTGYTRGELARMSIRDIAVEVTSEIWEQVKRQVIENLHAEFETVHRCKDGRKYPASVSLNYIRYSEKEYFCAYFADITERKKAEKAREEHLRFVQTLMDAIPTPLFYKDRAGVYLDCNTAYEKFLGYPKERIVGRSVKEIMSEEFSRQHEDSDLIVLQEDRPLAHETRGRHADGSVHDVIVYKAPFYNTAGTPEGIIGVILDITERKKVELAMAKARDYYRTIFENFPAMIWSTGIDGKCNFINRRRAEFTGREIEREPESCWADLIHPDDYARFTEQFLKAYNNRETFKLEYRLRHRTGEYRWIADTCIPYTDIGGSFAGYCGYSYDLTDQKNLERALIKAARFNGAVLDAISASIAVIDETGTIITTNEAWRKFSRENGAPDSPKTGVGANYFGVCEKAAGEGSDRAREVLEGMRAVLAGEKETFTAEYDCHSPDKQRWFSLKATRLSNAGMRGIVVIHTDITDRKLIEEEIQSFCTALNQKKIEHRVSDADSLPG